MGTVMVKAVMVVLLWRPVAEVVVVVFRWEKDETSSNWLLAVRYSRL